MANEETLLRVENLCQHFRLDAKTVNKAVDNVSFEIKKGEVIGIVGNNGAGKSTLLKVISGILRPTKGSVELGGNVVPMLELGRGFDYDLTGRENIFLNGSILGYSEKFLNSKYDEIVAFSELEEFQDRPFKQLSSGMKSRLAFSIASLLEPDILILDEVLSVGDGAFRAKSNAKMREIIADGATTLFVSHHLATVEEMCNKILWLDHGKQVAFGDNVKEICSDYRAFLKSKR